MSSHCETVRGCIKTRYLSWWRSNNLQLPERHSPADTSMHSSTCHLCFHSFDSSFETVELKHPQLYPPWWTALNNSACCADTHTLMLDHVIPALWARRRCFVPVLPHPGLCFFFFFFLNLCFWHSHQLSSIFSHFSLPSLRVCVVCVQKMFSVSITTPPLTAWDLSLSLSLWMKINK